MFNLFRGSYILEYFHDNVNRNAEYFPMVIRKPTIKKPHGVHSIRLLNLRNTAYVMVMVSMHPYHQYTLPLNQS